MLVDNVIEATIFIYLGFYVAFNTVQVISRRVVEATIDTAAWVTVVNTNVFLKLSDKNLRPKETVRLTCAGGNQYILLAKLYTDIPIKIGSVTVFRDVYVADITDNILLGLDFLLKYDVIIDLCESC